MTTIRFLAAICLTLLSLALPLTSQGRKGGGSGGSPPPAPDLACVSLTGSHALQVMNRDGSNLRDVLREDCYGTWPTLSPDARQVAFCKMRGSVAAVWVIGVDGTGLRAVTDLVSSSWYTGDRPIGIRPVWSPGPAPDGRHKLLFADMLTPSGSDHYLFVVNLDGTDRTQLTTEPVSHSHGPAYDWSPDASQVARLSTQWVPRIDAVTVVQLAAVGGRLAIVSSASVPLPTRGTSLAWGNTGSLLALALENPNHGGNGDLWLFDLAQPLAPVQLTDTSGWEIAPTLSSDDTQLFFSTIEGTKVLDLGGGGTPRLLTRKARYACHRRS